MEKNDDLTAMVVEDFHDARLILREFLEMKGYRVVEAADGWEAVGLATRDRPDLILMDLHLPVLDGVEAACLLRELEGFREVPMIAITAHDSAESRADAADCGFDEYVTKPIDFDHLGVLVDRIFKRREGGRGRGARPAPANFIHLPTYSQ